MFQCCLPRTAQSAQIWRRPPGLLGCWTSALIISAVETPFLNGYVQILELPLLEHIMRLLSVVAWLCLVMLRRTAKSRSALMTLGSVHYVLHLLSWRSQAMWMRMVLE